jgi:hypothetical protein
MKPRYLKWALGLALVSLLPVPAMAQGWWWGGDGGGTPSTYNSVQSNFDPLGWALADPNGVQMCTCTDSATLDFQANLPGFLTTIGTSLKEGIAFAAANNHLLDPTRLYFTTAYAPRIYFISNGGWYTDALGVTIGTATAMGSNAPSGNNYLVFPNANSWYSNNCPAKVANGDQRTQYCPLLSGDFVQLPTVQAGQSLNLVFLSNLDSNGNVPAGYTFYNNPAANADQYQHMAAFFPADGRYIIVGFEDEYGGGDKDFNDVVIVIDVGYSNGAAMLNPVSGGNGSGTGGSAGGGTSGSGLGLPK